MFLNEKIKSSILFIFIFVLFAVLGMPNGGESLGGEPVGEIFLYSSEMIHLTNNTQYFTIKYITTHFRNNSTQYQPEI